MRDVPSPPNPSFLFVGPQDMHVGSMTQRLAVVVVASATLCCWVGWVSILTRQQAVVYTDGAVKWYPCTVVYNIAQIVYIHSVQQAASFSVPLWLHGFGFFKMHCSGSDINHCNNMALLFLFAQWDGPTGLQAELGRAGSSQCWLGESKIETATTQEQHVYRKRKGSGLCICLFYFIF